MRKLITLIFLFISTVTLGQRVQYFNGNGQSTTSGAGSLNQVLTVSATGVASWVALPAASPVTSVFGRTGAVVSATADYTFSQIGSTPTTIAGYGITDFNTLGDARYGRLSGSTYSSSNTFINTAGIIGLTSAGSPINLLRFTSGNAIQIGAAATSGTYTTLRYFAGNGNETWNILATGAFLLKSTGGPTDGGYYLDVQTAATNGYFKAGNLIVDASGNVTAATQAAADNTTKVATTAFVTTADNLKANLASPTFTGTPSLPTGTTGVTQTAGDNSTKLATTAYVDKSEILLSAITGINTLSTGTTALYTVPAGKTVIVTKVAIRVTAATAITTGPTVDIGVTAGDIYASTALTSLTSLNKVFGFFSTGISMAATAAQVINLNINTPAVGTSQVVECLIYGNLR